MAYPIPSICGILHFNDEVTPHDSEGCVLAEGHEGPHEFIASNGKRYLWETDLECECEHCMQALGDYCTIYWKKPDAEKK